jgi:peptidoglycan/LPS O-acetylase OafA/YrhL
MAFFCWSLWVHRCSPGTELALITALMRAAIKTARVCLFSHVAFASAPVVAVSNRIPALDGVRGLAILLVMLHHFTLNFAAEAWLPKLGLRVLGAGWFGVDLFFVLSGFLITGILYDAKNSPVYFRSFYMRRVLRIFPLYYGVLLLVFVGAPLFSSPAILADSGEAFSNQAWLWSYGTNILIAWRKSWIFDSGWLQLGHFWSLAVEEQFYMVWPFVVLWCTRRTLVKVCLAVGAFALAIRVLLHLFDGHYAPIYVLSPCRMDALAAGALLALLARAENGLQSLLRPSIMAAAIAGCFLLGVFVKRRQLLTTDPAVYTLGYSALAIILAAFLLHVLTTQPHSLCGRIWGCSGLRFLGKYSYGLYVFHPPIQAFLWNALPPATLASLLGSKPAGFFAYLTLAFAVSISIAFLSWHLFEKHFLQLKRLFPMRAVPSAVKADISSGELVRASSPLTNSAGCT